MEWFFGIVYVVAIALPLMSAITKVVADVKYPYWSQDWWRLVDLAFWMFVAEIPILFLAVLTSDNKRQVFVVTTCLIVAVVMTLCWRGLAEGICKLACLFTSKAYVASLKARRATTRMRRLSDTID